jgi:hypothetical protein
MRFMADILENFLDENGKLNGTKICEALEDLQLIAREKEDQVIAANFQIAELTSQRDKPRKIEFLEDEAAMWKDKYSRMESERDDWKQRCEAFAVQYDALRAEIEAIKTAQGVPDRNPIQGEQFVRAWVNLEKFPGGMMGGSKGLFGPIPGSTNCFITTSENVLKIWQDNGEKFIEVWRADAPALQEQPTAIDMIMYCPNCGKQHVDSAEAHKDESPECAWANPPHRSHLCHNCGCIWRPADVATNGVAEIKTEGKADTWVVHDEISAQPSTPNADASKKA